MTGWSRWLGTAAASRILELPRRSAPPERIAPTDVGRRQRLAAVVSAYHAATEALLFGWSRRAPGAPVDVFAGGALAGVLDPSGTVRLSLPQGGIGRRYRDGALLERLRAVPWWTRVGSVADGLLIDDPTVRPDEVRPSLDECLLHVWHGGFAWLLLAEPVLAGPLAALTDTVAAAERTARSKSTSPEQAVLAARLEHRHRELRQGESTGMWRLHLLAGSATPGAARSVAGLLCASADLTALPYALRPGGAVADLDGALAEDANDSVVSSLLVASLAAPPIDEVPGVRLTLRPEFDVTPETGDEHDDAFPLGVVLDRGGAALDRFHVPVASLNRHMFVCGATGSGKSQTIRGLLETVAPRVPWLVVEPVKAEYRQMAGRIGADNVIIIRPGDPDTAPAGFNPLRPAPGFPLQTHVDLVRSLCLAAFAADEPFPQVLSAALIRCYEERGWDLALGEPRAPGTEPHWPTLGDLQQTAERVVDEIGYSTEITDNVRGFIRIRLASLRLGTTGRFFEGGHPLDFARLTRRNVVFEIEDVGDDRDKAFLMGALLIQLVEHLRVEARHRPAILREGLRHLSVFEEAHRLLRRDEVTGPAARALELFASLLAEIRAYGEGLIIAEQIPSKLVPDVIKNTAVKVLHRLPALDDREAVGATINLTERQSRYLVTLPPGTGALFTDGMDEPVLVRMPDGTHRERGGNTETAPVNELIGRRSTTCGEECRATACTLREMRLAQHLLDDEPWIPLWAELSVLGHLTGWPTPVIRAAHMRSLLALPARLRGCTLSQAVDDAVAVRSSVLSPGPDAVAAHVLDTLLGYLSGVNRCDSDEPHFLARPGARGTVTFGTRMPSTIERCVGSSLGGPGWPGRVATTLDEHFAACTWPRRYLVTKED